MGAVTLGIRTTKAADASDNSLSGTFAETPA
jgi:hypothetical protein